MAAILLGALTMLPPLSIDVSLPGLPVIARALHAPGSSIGWSLSAFVLAFGAGQLVLGPLSDRVGRRPVLLAGLAAFTALALACAFATNIYELVAMRLAQGLSACAGTVCARAIVADIAPDTNAAARLQALVSATNSLAPILAPLIGVALFAALGWRSLYGSLAVVGVALFIVVALLLDETSPRTARDAVQSYRRVLTQTPTPAIAVIVLFGFAGFFALVANSSLVLQKQLHVSSTLFALAFAGSASATLGGSFVAAKSVAMVGSQRLLQIGIASIGVAGLIAFLLDVGAPSPLTFSLTMAAFAFAYGLFVPAAYASALAGAGANAGAGAALLGAAQMFGGAIGSATVSALPLQPSASTGSVVLLCAIGSIGAFALSPATCAWRPNQAK